MKSHVLCAVCAILVLASFSGCTTLSQGERNTIRELESVGLTEYRTVKNPALAGALNLLPGFGNFYLAVGTGENNHWLYGVVNLLLWPYSPAWAIPEAVVDANTINKKEAINYYTNDPQGKLEYDRAKSASGGGSPGGFQRTGG